MEFSACEFIHFFNSVADKMEDNKDYLCELDRKLGDGDHGVTMSIGWQAVDEKLKGELVNEEDCGKINMIVGKTFLNAVGSSVGPLYATGFMRGAKIIKGKTVVDDRALIDYWIAFGKGVQERGQAKKGDKTMVDTFVPFVDALETGREEDFLHVFQKAVVSAEEGMNHTKELISKKGRSSRLGDRSIGVQDPGATSAYLILAAFYDFVESKSKKISESTI
ncbi:dihydroxyacetone kinase subunit DhaL [Virgibacillus siamensis]|uniref:dihydroxyacetone kinase subunit DhaL n=1 Tax=Virgibacillus siamensis TaxID=480071 RepID=UPI00098518F0|nr:dihydroxyacetone kinase subunit DhaL [Virgibacillus siamensis]